MEQKEPIGIFDSGIGGLTVAKAISTSLDLAKSNRFAALLATKSEPAQKDFQELLKKYRMSSHVWVFAKHP